MRAAFHRILSDSFCSIDTLEDKEWSVGYEEWEVEWTFKCRLPLRDRRKYDICTGIIVCAWQPTFNLYNGIDDFSNRSR